MPTKKEIGKYLREYLVSNGICILDFAREIGVSQSSIYNWFAGQGMLNIYYAKLLNILATYYGFEVPKKYR